uniref:Uncharacterized protein n=1 Tax=viral metagenome TaxID=1070528 RepID=A0A6M3IKN6_9ZZZZ
MNLTTMLNATRTFPTRRQAENVMREWSEFLSANLTVIHADDGWRIVKSH